MKTYHFLPVLLLLISLYVGLHFYAARWLIRSFELGQPGASWLRLALLTVGFLSPLIMFLKRHPHGPALEALFAAGYAWMGLIFIAAFVFACSDLAALLLRRAAWLQPGMLTGGTLALLAAITAWGLYAAQKVPDLKEIAVPVRDLPPSLEGLKIAQLSDVHLDSEWKLRRFSRIVDRINSAEPDLVLVTGDLIDPGINCSAGLDDLTARLKSRLGLYGALGNHEYYFGLDGSMDCYKAFGIKLLKNEGLDLPGIKDVRLIGLGDIHTEHLTEQDVAAILKKAGSAKLNILMSHQPVYYGTIAETGDYLVLSGHTHKGQLFPFHVFVKLFYKYFYGLHRLKNSVFYITSGSGTWGPPLRWLAPSEIPLLRLTKAP